MLEYTTAGDGARLSLILDHTDAAGEWAYDRTSHVGKLDKASTRRRRRAGRSST